MRTNPKRFWLIKVSCSKLRECINRRCISQPDKAPFEVHTCKVRAEKELQYGEERRSYYNYYQL